MRNLRIIIIIVAGSILTVTALYLINDINVSIRLTELKIYLQNIDYNENKNDHAELVSKFLMHKNMYEEKISRDEVDSIEFRMNLIKRSKNSYNKIQMIKYPVISKPAIFVINLNRKFIGKQAIQDLQPDSDLSEDLDLAYYLERNEYYQRASQKYETVLSDEIRDPSLSAGVLLHYGFCNAMIGNIARAKQIFNLIIDSYSSDDSSVTASLLLWYIEYFKSLKLEILKTEDSETKGRKLYYILAYKEALSTIENLEAKSPGSQLPKLQYYKALCYNEMGEKEKAVDVYLDIMKKNPESKYARLSNRRIYMIGSKAGGENKVKKASVIMNKYYKDNKLTEMIDQENTKSRQEEAVEQTENNKIPLDKIETIIDKHEELKNFNYLGKQVVISTKDGDKYIGEVKAVTESYYTLSTIIGKVNVKKERINNITIQE